MKILITNDDGIYAPGLKVLERIATAIAGPQGEVWTVAPAFEQSGVGHAISYIKPVMISEIGPRRFACEGTPADCVLAGIHEVMHAPPDLVLSGVNRGNNSAENALYSGTIGAAIEAALQGLRAIALSQFWGPGNAALDDPYESADAHGEATVRHLLEAGLWDDAASYRLFYNVNFPPCSAEATKGPRVAAQGYREATSFTVAPHVSPTGRKFLWARGGAQHHPTASGTDAAANLDGYISITPMRCDLTAHDRLAALKARLE
jgi:5'/3'-nucleotidase